MFSVKKSFVVLAVLGTLMFLAAPTVADWKPEDGHKMHFPQLPDEDGWDVNATWPKVLADDWTCSETGWVKDIHFWGSWMYGQTGFINSFHLSIHDNIPEGPNGYSMPGVQLWDYEATEFGVVPIDPPTQQGWYDPSTGECWHPDHDNYFQYNVILPRDFWFPQEEGTVYWLDISANVRDGMWGWKTADVEKYPGEHQGKHYLDDAVWGDFSAAGGGLVDGWHELIDPVTGASLDLAFVITPEPGTLVLLAMAGLGLLLFAWRRRK